MSQGCSPNTESRPLGKTLPRTKRREARRNGTQVWSTISIPQFAEAKISVIGSPESLLSPGSCGLHQRLFDAGCIVATCRSAFKFPYRLSQCPGSRSSLEDWVILRSKSHACPVTGLRSWDAARERPGGRRSVNPKALTWKRLCTLYKRKLTRSVV